MNPRLQKKLTDPSCWGGYKKNTEKDDGENTTPTEINILPDSVIVDNILKQCA